MSVREYIGARYVPVFADPIEWDSTRTYEPLTIVMYQGNSYTSRQAVPANIPIDNTTYWALTSNYNAQVEQYRQEVQTLGGQINVLENTVSPYTPANPIQSAIEAIEGTLFPYSPTNTLKSAIEAVEEEVSQNTESINILNNKDAEYYIDFSDITKVGTINRVIDGISYVPQSMCYDANYLYVGFASGNRVDSVLAKLDPDTLEIIDKRYVSEMYCHFNSLSVYNDELFTASPEKSTYNNVNGVYITVFDKNTLAFKRAILVSTGVVRWSNFIIGTNKAKPTSPIIQSFNDYMSAFVDYGTVNDGNTQVLCPISKADFRRINGFIADGCVLKTNATGNLQNIFAYICTSFNNNPNPYITRKNSIVLVQPNGYILQPIVLPIELNDIELEGITTDDTYIYLNTVYGDVYKFQYNIDNFTELNPYNVVKENLQARVYSRNITNLGCAFTNGYITRRICISNYGYANYGSDPISVMRNNMSARSEYIDGTTINVAGIYGQSTTVYGLFWCKYIAKSYSNSNSVQFELDQMRVIPLSANPSSPLFARDNISNDSDADLITALNASFASASYFALGLTGKNIPSGMDEYFVLRDVL